MSRPVSIGAQVKQLSALLGTADLNDWEQRFAGDIAQRSRDGQDTTRLTEKQIDVIDRIWRKHFA